MSEIKRGRRRAALKKEPNRYDVDIFDLTHIRRLWLRTDRKIGEYTAVTSCLKLCTIAVKSLRCGGQTEMRPR